MNQNEFEKLFAAEITDNSNRPKNQKRYSDDFKSRALALLSEGVSPDDAARIAQVSKSTLFLWRKQDQLKDIMAPSKMMRIDQVLPNIQQTDKSLVVEYPSGLCVKIPIQI
jgi:transposase-like protein